MVFRKKRWTTYEDCWNIFLNYHTDDQSIGCLWFLYDVATCWLIISFASWNIWVNWISKSNVLCLNIAKKLIKLKVWKILVMGEFGLSFGPNRYGPSQLIPIMDKYFSILNYLKLKSQYLLEHNRSSRHRYGIHWLKGLLKKVPNN